MRALHWETTISWHKVDGSLVPDPERLCSCAALGITASSGTKTRSAPALAGTDWCPAPALPLIPGHAAACLLFHSTWFLKMRNIPVGLSSAPCKVPQEKRTAIAPERAGRARKIPGSFTPDQTQGQGGEELLDAVWWFVKKGAGGEMRIAEGCGGGKEVSCCAADTTLPLHPRRGSSAEAVSPLLVYLVD